MAEGRRETLGAGRAVGSGFAALLTISGPRCRAEGAPRERALAALDGVRSVRFSQLRGRACIELSCLTLLETIVTMLGHNGFPLETEEVEVTTWIAGSAERLLALEQQLIGLPNVAFCRVFGPTGRIDYGANKFHSGGELSVTVSLSSKFEFIFVDNFFRTSQARRPAETNQQTVESHHKA